MQSQVFNQNWFFRKDGAEGTGTQVTLPHDAQIVEPRSPDMPMDSGYFPGSKYIYTKKWLCPSAYAGKRLYLEFDGVYMNAEVFVNGHSVAFQPYGYINFWVPVHEHIAIGAENEITVIADNSCFPNARWYTGAGIYREVMLHVAEPQHILPFGVKVRTLSHTPVRISVSIEPTTKLGLTAKTEIFFNDASVATAEGFDIELDIPDAKLWSAESPCLYQARVSLMAEDTVVDEAIETFGIRTLEWDASYGLKLNGESILLRGACVHHDNGLLGAAAFPEVEERKARLLKEAGFNALRSSHNPCSKAMLDACDRLGLYMMDEFADMWTQHKHKHDYAGEFRQWYERDLTALVQRGFNHPSLIMYSIGNEVGESALPEGVEYAKKMKDLVHALDGTRPVTCGINLLLNGLTAMGKGLYNGEDSPTAKKENKSSGSTFINGVMSNMGSVINNVGRMKKFDLATRDVFAVLDIAGYNYGSGRYKIDPKRYPKRITVGSETLPPYLYRNWQAVKAYPNLIGDFMWTGWDYLGEAGIGMVGYGDNTGMLKPYPTLLAGCGVIEITGEFRPEVYWNQIIWGLRCQPYISVEPLNHAGEKAGFGMWRQTDGRHNWAWRGCEGRSTKVIVYAEADSVELTLNGKSLGRRKVKECKAVFSKVVYQPGELRAIAYGSKGEELGEDTLLSADASLQIKLASEDSAFERGNLVYVNMEITDANGIREYCADCPISIQVEGGTLLALGSANPVTAESFDAHTHQSFYGMLQAIVKPDSEASAIRLTATANELSSAYIEISHK